MYYSNLFLVFFTNGPSSIHIELPKKEADINKFITYIIKNIRL